MRRRPHHRPRQLPDPACAAKGTGDSCDWHLNRIRQYARRSYRPDNKATSRLLVGDGFRVPPVYAGRDRPHEQNRACAETPAELALRAALADRPLVIVALGP